MMDVIYLEKFICFSVFIKFVIQENLEVNDLDIGSESSPDNPGLPVHVGSRINTPLIG